MAGYGSMETQPNAKQEIFAPKRDESKLWGCLIVYRIIHEVDASTKMEKEHTHISGKEVTLSTLKG